MYEKLREFHNQKLIVSHEFDIFIQIEFYESLWEDKASIYRDYVQTKNNVFILKNILIHRRRKNALLILMQFRIIFIYDRWDSQINRLGICRYAGSPCGYRHVLYLFSI